MSLADPERIKDFFCTDEHARLYDETIGLVVPNYDIQHDFGSSLVKNHLDRSSDSISVILDVGSGTGGEAIRILRENPSTRLVAVDYCEHMQNIMTERLNSYGLYDRCVQVVEDFLSPQCSSSFLRDLAASLSHHQGGRFAVVVSAFTFHHFTAQEKHLAYQRVHEVLCSNGLFINSDLVTFISKPLAKGGHLHDLKWIDEAFLHPLEVDPKAATLPLETRLKLRTLWRRHYEVANQLEPIEYQIARMEAVGFRELGVPYRYWQSAILYALK